MFGGVPLVGLTAPALLLLVVLLAITRRLVWYTDLRDVKNEARQAVEDARREARQAVEDAQHEAQEWRIEGRLKDQQIAEKDEQLGHMAEVGRTLNQVLKALGVIAQPKDGSS